MNDIEKFADNLITSLDRRGCNAVSQAVREAIRTTAGVKPDYETQANVLTLTLKELTCALFPDLSKDEAHNKTIDQIIIQAEALNNRKINNGKEIDKLRNQLADAKGFLITMTMERDSLINDLRKLKNELTNSEAKVCSLVIDRDTLHGVVDRLNSELAGKINYIAKLSNSLDNSHFEYESLKRELAKAEATATLDPNYPLTPLKVGDKVRLKDATICHIIEDSGQVYVQIDGGKSNCNNSIHSCNILGRVLSK